MQQISVPSALLNFIQAGDSFCIAGHMEPDGDCIGSQLALSAFLRRLGKKTFLFSNGPFKRTEIKEYESLFTSHLPVGDYSKTRLIVLDCSNFDRIGEVPPAFNSMPTASIDHHARGLPFGEVQFIEPQSPSTSLLILALIEAMDRKPTKEEADALFLGFCSDTGFFRHLHENSAIWVEMASRLISAGASPKRTFQHIHGGKSLDSRRLLGILLQRCESYYDGQLLVSWETMEDTQAYGLEGRDSDMLYQLLQSVENVQAIAVIRQEREDFCTVGLRSKDKIDVSKIAADFGGGGHQQASGIGIHAKIAELKPKIIHAFKEQLTVSSDKCNNM